MANNKVELSTGEVLIDLTGDTVASDKILSGYTAHDRSGASITGTVNLNDYVLKSGDTMTGSLSVINSEITVAGATSAHGVNVRGSGGLTVTLHLAASGDHGIYSSGYASSPTATATASGSWIINRTNDNYVVVPKWASIGSSDVPVYFDSTGKPIACGILSSVYHLHNIDSRSSNYTPNQYLSDSNARYSLLFEFKTRTTIDAPGSSTFGNLFTVVPWGDSSGGYPFQLYGSADGILAYRSSNSNGTGWNSWEKIALEDGVIIRGSWWNGSDTTKNIDDLRGGIVFAYKSSHNAPCTGTAVAFDCASSTSYTLQLMGSYNENKLYFRNRQGDNSKWNPWREVNSCTSILGNYYNRYGGYAASARITSANLTSTDCAGIKTFLATSSMTTSKPASDGNIMHFEWDNGTRYSSQLAIIHESGRLQHRYQTGAGNTASDWTQWYSVYSEAYKPGWSDIQNKPTIGTVTSVAVTGSKGISISGSPITSSGTIDVSVSTSSGTASRNTTNTSAGEVKYQKYGRVVTIYTTAQITITSTGAALDKTYFTGLPKPPAMVTFTATGPGNKAVALQITTDGYVKGVYNAPPSGVLTIGTSYIAAS